uniref:Cytochrome P450 71A1 n=1 Tax=Aegilops tauschii TaxID=37682 RepID=M8CDH7_AEGTA
MELNLVSYVSIALFVLSGAYDLFAGFTVGDFFPELEPFASTVTGLRRRLKRCLADLREVCDDIVEEHVSGKHQRLPGDRDEDFVDVLLRVQKSPDLEVPLTDDNLKALVLDMFVAGTDTTFATLEWVMTELVRHPRILQKAQEEVRRVWALPAGVRAEDVSVEETFGLATRKKEPLFVAVRKSDVYQFKGEELNEV